MPLTQVSPGLLDSNAQYYGFKNRIINGAMVIDQRNNGASVTPTASGYSLDRWLATIGAASKYSVQRSAVAPVGFNNSLLVTSLSAYAITSTNVFMLGHRIEGFNVADLGWGTASAQTVTLSFQVRSSLTGTFGGVILNSAENRSYPFTYTISAANTFETKTITIPGDTTGTWLTDSGIGIGVYFGLGVGSSFSGPAGSWAGATYYGATGATSVVGTNGATFYITGVQLEKGSTATSFDYRPYGTELQLAQRYFQLNIPTLGWSTSTTNVAANISGSVLMRSAPTAALFNGANGIGDFGVSYRNITAITALGNTDVYGGEINMTPATSTTANKGQGIRGSAIGLSAEL